MIKEAGKMNAKRTIDSTKYAQLLTQTLPLVIETEEENEHFLEIIKSMMDKELSPEENVLFNLLVTLVEKFEDEHYKMPVEESSPDKMIRFLMEQRDLELKNLYHIFSGSRGLTSDVVNGKRKPSKAQAKALAEFFHVSTDLFL